MINTDFSRWIQSAAVSKLTRADTAACESSVTIKSWANNRYVAVELNPVDYTGGDYGMLRARTDKPDAWEAFKISCSSCVDMWTVP